MTIRFDFTLLEFEDGRYSVGMPQIRAFVKLADQLETRRRLTLENRVIINPRGFEVGIAAATGAAGHNGLVPAALTAFEAGLPLAAGLEEMHSRIATARNRPGGYVVPLPTDGMNLNLNRALHEAELLGVVPHFTGDAAELRLPSVAPEELVCAVRAEPPRTIQFDGICIGAELLSDFRHPDLFDDLEVVVRYTIAQAEPVDTVCVTLPYSQCHVRIGLTRIRVVARLLAGAGFATATQLPEFTDN